MKLTTKARMNEVDREAITSYQIPALLLMEHAAYSIFKYINNQYQEEQSITICCGPGNNGGDGLALARQLTIWSKHKVGIILLAEKEQLSEDGKAYYNICKNMNIPIHEENTLKENVRLLKESSIIVDALFGTGLTRQIQGDYYQLIDQINQFSKDIISIDIPSGIEADTGRILGIAIKADITITFALPKVGLYLYPGVEYAGEVKVADIGIPSHIIETCPSTIYTMDEACAKSYLPSRTTRSNKGTYGKVLVIGGQKGMSGAITLCAQSCMRAGAGTVTVAVPQSIHDILESKLTESMTIALPDDEGHIAKEAIPILSELIDKYDVIAIGPGIGRHEEIKEIIKVILRSDKPCIIDADGLHALKGQMELLKARTSPTVITPHPGEFSYLIESNIPEILERPLEVVRAFMAQYPITLVLKLEKTIIADHAQIFINTTGNNGLAKGGSGDVLTGIIAALIGQKLSSEKAARLGVYLHGKSADYIAQAKSVYAVLPSDVSLGLGEVFKELII